MAAWVTHLMVADAVLRECPWLDRRGFCVGNIAPDCNVENADWTAFTPSREVTHWMSGSRKVSGDCERFYEAYILGRRGHIRSNEEYSFLLGYYSHLITDAEFQWFIRDEQRVQAVWDRIRADDILRERAAGYPETWDSVKKLIPTKERMCEIGSMEAEYLREHPDSGYLTEILPLEEFPDYIDYLPHGAVVRKIGVMGQVPEPDEAPGEPVSLSREEFRFFAEHTAAAVTNAIREKSAAVIDVR